MLITFWGVDNFSSSFDKLSCHLFGNVKKISYIVRVRRVGEYLLIKKKMQKSEENAWIYGNFFVYLLCK